MKFSKNKLRVTQRGNHFLRNPFLLLCVLAVLIPRITMGNEQEAKHFVSWPPLEPDKCIAAWLMKTYVNTNTSFSFLPKGTTPTNGIPFDIPGSNWSRDHRYCVSEKVMQKSKVTPPEALALIELSRKAEMGFWAASFSQRETELIEQLKQLQLTEMDYSDQLQSAFSIIETWLAGGVSP